MEIKRRLTKLGKALSPQIESMNVSNEMHRLLDRFEELVRYAQEKIDRTAERKGKTNGQIAQEAREAADKVISDHQTAEAEENLRDQQEAFDERNKDPGAIEEMLEDIGRGNPPPIPAAVELMEKEANEEPPKQRKKKAAKKKAKKKKVGKKKR